ncbi:MAG: alpha/beta fold hydrolase [Gemmatimonadaceae bacterium]
MKARTVFLALAIGAAQLHAQPPARTYVLVHGAWGGSWAFRQVDSLLSASGHTVYRPSLTGLGERVHLAGPEVDLTTHVSDVVNTLLFENLRDVVLVGHSYAGMVVAGVAEQVPERIRHIVFIDAFVPEDGESVVTAARGTRVEPLVRRMVDSAKAGLMTPFWVKPKTPPPTDVPHPLKTFTEPLAIRNRASRRLPATYILTVAPGEAEAEDDFALFSRRAKSRGWAHYVLRADHIPERSAPTALVALLRRIP